MFICDECVQLCQVFNNVSVGTLSGNSEPGTSCVEACVAAFLAMIPLAGYNGAFERVDAGMQDIVDILREREVSWATIGRALAQLGG